MWACLPAGGQPNVVEHADQISPGENLLPRRQDRLSDTADQPFGAGEIFEMGTVGQQSSGRFGSDAADPRDIVRRVADQGSPVAPLVRDNPKSLHDLLSSNDAPPGCSRGAEHVHSVVEELVVVAVPADDEAMPITGESNCRSDDIVRFVLLALDPRQADSVEAAFDVRQALDRPWGLRRPIGLVAKIDALTGRSTQFPVENHHNFRIIGDVFPDSLAQEREEHKNAGQIPAVAAGDRGRLKSRM